MIFSSLRSLVFIPSMVISGIIRILHGIVAMTWVLTLMLLVLIPSIVQWSWLALVRLFTSPIRVTNAVLASKLGQACCTSRDPQDQINSFKDPRIISQTHTVRISNGSFTLRIDRLFRSDFHGSNNFIPVILQHGVLQSGGIFLVNGQNSMAYHLLNAGFDVWIPNSRGSYCKSEELVNPERWQFTLDELGEQDIPAVVSYVVQQTGKRVVYAGHSQGASSGVVAFNTEPELMRQNIRLFIALAPAILLKPQEHWFFTKVLIPHPTMFETLGGRASFASALFSIQDHLPNTVWSLLGIWAVSYLFKWHPIEMWRPDFIGQYFLFAPAKTSAKLVSNWINMLGFGRIRSAKTGQLYSLEPLSGCKIAVIYGEDDNLVEAGTPLLTEMRQVGCDVVLHKGIPNYNHLDLLWAKTAPELVFDQMIHVIHNTNNKGDPSNNTPQLFHPIIERIGSN